MPLKPPVLIVGATRSGTTMLMKVMGSAPGLCFWWEPGTLWRVGHAYRDHDFASAADAKPWVKRWIRHRFLKFQQAHGDRRVVEKLPNNVLRIPFLRAVFPEAKIVHIYRDGRANLRSQVEQFEKFSGFNVFSRDASRHLSARLAQTPFWEWPAYFRPLARGVARRYILRKPGVQWFGIRYPGWRDDLKNLTTAQIAAKQWVISVETALRDLQDVPADRWISLNYRDLVLAPELWLRRIAEFCEFEVTDEYLSSVRRDVHARSLDRWISELDPNALHEAMPIMGSLLDKLDYLSPGAPLPTGATAGCA